ncbi:phosphatidylinositol-specific phospholipase C1-like protein [Puia dinghuensis]|nr:phosphatidylinositol-specific phospholipase C1-like protein [Puia dinghuensis]
MKQLLAAALILLLASKKDTGFDDLPINKVQVIGSHNSYKQAIDTALFSMLKAKNPQVAEGLEYSHVSLGEQLTLGLRNLEIDVYADEKGGKYAHPKGLEWEAAAHPPAYDPTGEMNKPGFKVFHVQDLDFRSNCYSFAGCLHQLKAWSDAHPDHYPIYITMNAKDQEIKSPGFTIPEKFTTEVFDRLDKEILDNLGREYLITPDDIRGNYPTLEQAVLANHWPTMKAARGKFIFILDEGGEHRSAYIAAHPSLKDRVLFTDSPSGTPEAAFMIINDAKRDQEKIKEMVKKGYMVRTRADSDTKEARINDKSSFMAACTSGAQIITTDYYYKSKFFPSDYVVSFDGGTYIRRMP